MKKKNLILVSGMALFSMFFGAGNLIFPPYLGYRVGDQFFVAILGFLLSSVGLVFMGLLSTTKCGGTIEKMGDTIRGSKLGI